MKGKGSTIGHCLMEILSKIEQFIYINRKTNAIVNGYLQQSVKQGTAGWEQRLKLALYLKQSKIYIKF